jgi:hypothetical protein
MKEKKQSKEDEEVKQIVSKNQEVIEALKRLSTLISNDTLIQKPNSVFESTEIQHDKLID